MKRILQLTILFLTVSGLLTFETFSSSAGVSGKETNYKISNDNRNTNSNGNRNSNVNGSSNRGKDDDRKGRHGRRRRGRGKN